jgi:hypothetical protein
MQSKGNPTCTVLVVLIALVSFAARLGNRIVNRDARKTATKMMADDRCWSVKFAERPGPLSEPAPLLSVSSLDLLNPGDAPVTCFTA